MIEKKDDNYFSYYVFVAISSVIGAVALFAFTKVAIRLFVEKGMLNIAVSGNLIPTIVALVGALIFVAIAIFLKGILKTFFFSELFLYIYMGVLTTAVNIIAFQCLLNIFAKDSASNSMGWKLAEIFAFIIALIFAFVTNKIFVFKSKDLSLKILGKEFVGFTGARLLTEIINFVIMWVMIDKNHFNEFFTKVLASVIVIVVNYIFSKFIIFKKK